MTAGLERSRIDLGRQRQRDDRANAGDGGQAFTNLVGFVRGGQFDIELFDLRTEFLDLLTQQDEALFGHCRDGGLLFNSR